MLSPEDFFLTFYFWKPQDDRTFISQLPYETSCPSVDLSVGRSLFSIYQIGKETSFAPIGSLDYSSLALAILSTSILIELLLQNMKRKGYPEGLDQIENTPEIAAVDVRLKHEIRLYLFHFAL